jgi:outer membrane murein-binding lipoprotein Lpp
MFSFFLMISAMVLFITTYTAALTGPSCSLRTLALDSNRSVSSSTLPLSNGFPREFSMADWMQLHREEAEKAREEAEKARQHSMNLTMLVKNQSGETLAKFLEQMNAGFAAVKADVAAVAADVVAVKADVVAVKADVVAVKADVVAVNAKVDAVAADVVAVNAKVDAVAADVAAVRTELRDGFSAANDDRERIRLNVSLTSSNVAQLGQQADETKQRVRDVERQVGVNRFLSSIATSLAKDALTEKCASLKKAMASPFKQAWKKVRELFGQK